MRITRARVCAESKISGEDMYFRRKKDILSPFFPEENRLFVNPNPVRQSGSFAVIINEQQSGELQVIDVNGLVLQRLIIENGGSIQLPAIRLPAGLYLLRFAGNNLKVRTGRLVLY